MTLNHLGEYGRGEAAFALSGEGEHTLDLFAGGTWVQPEFLQGLRALEAGDFDVRVSLNGDPLMAEISEAFNRIAEINESYPRLKLGFYVAKCRKA